MSCTKKETLNKDKTAPRDTLGGDYSETITEDGIPVKRNFYTDNELKSTDFYKNGLLFDRVRLDSLGNIVKHEPIIVCDNSESISNTDTLFFKIKNVDSLTFYQYYFTTDQLQFDLEGIEKVRNQIPIDSRNFPYIKVPKDILKHHSKIYFKWGYLVDIKDSADTQIHHWQHMDETFELNLQNKKYAQQQL